MIKIKGRENRWVQGQREIVENDLYLLGVFDENGNLHTYARSGRPCTYRVYESLTECRNGIRSLKRDYNGTLKPVRILTGEIVEEAV